MLQQLPRPVLVFLVLAIGIGLFFLIQEPHTVCDSQKEVFLEAQKGQLFPQKIKNATQSPYYAKGLQSCRMGNSPGACYELFLLLKKMLRDLNSGSQECQAPLGEIPEVKRAVLESLELLALIAWGDQPPEQSLSKFAWLETPDLALYCDLKAFFLRAYGEENWIDFRRNVYQKLPGEPAIFKDGQCENCESKKSALQVLAEEQIWVRSLFSFRCESIR